MSLANMDVSYMAYLASEVVVAVLALVGNALTLTVFAVDRKLRRLTNYYIASLALADLLVGIFGVPFAILTFLGLPQHLSACLLMLSTLIVLCTISIFCLVAVSLDRYWAILHPLMYSRLMTKNIARRVIVCCWVAGGIVGLLPMAGWHQNMDGLCVFTKVMDYSFLVFLYFATIVGPGILMAAFYTLIYTVVIKQLRQISAQESVYEDQHRLQLQMQADLQGDKSQQGVFPEGSKDGDTNQNDTTAADVRGRGRRGTIMQEAAKQVTHASRREVKAAKNLSIIVLFFMICWFPLYTINCINAFCERCAIPLHVTNFTIILSHANSAINPFLYAYHMKDFRYALKVLVLGKLLGRKVVGKDPYLRGSHLVSPHHSTWHRVGAGNQRSSALHTPHTRTPPAALTPYEGSPFDPVSRSRTSTVDSQGFRSISRAVSSSPSLQQELNSLSPDYRPEGLTTSGSKTSLNPYFQRSQARPRAATLMSHTSPFSSSSREPTADRKSPRRPVSLLTDHVPLSQTIFEAKSPSQPNITTDTHMSSPVIVRVGELETVRHVFSVPVVPRSQVTKRELGDPPPSHYSDKSIFSLTTNSDTSSANDHGGGGGDGHDDDLPSRRSSSPPPPRIQSHARNASDAVTVELCDKKTIHSVMDKICSSNKRAFSYTGCSNGLDTTMCELNAGSGRIATGAISNATGHKEKL
ncbi:adenosine receptor isoform X2 [Oratosquilla oratoria]|uniref:adenosine receptor isoform X2 n=1 Tax=Oratosquilla oratoria TaxID=337810 RepID=UPI003F7675B7